MNELINPPTWTRVRADASSRRYGGNELPSEMIALEPRVMLDGAIALAAAEEAPADDNAPADDRGATGEPAAQAQNSETETGAENSGTTSETEAASGSEPGNTIVIVDAAIEDPAALLEGIDPSADVFYLVAGADGVEQITNILATQSTVSSLHILSHGETGSVTIGATTLTLSNIETYAADFVGWDVAFADGADILLYGCNVAEDQSGLDFIDLFAELTHTDVAASTDLTGGVAVGGDWVLEAQTGTIDAASPLNATALAGYQHTLVFDEIGDNDFRISEVGSSGAPAGSAIRPEVAYNSTDNEYLVVWRGVEPDLLSGSTEIEIFGRRLDAATGMAIGSDFRISDVDGDGLSSQDIGDPSVVYNSVDNEYLVVWSAEDPDFGLTDGDEIFGQRIAADGTEIGIDFQISDAHSGEFRGGFEPDVTYNSVENEYLVVWHADDAAASLSRFQYEVFGQRIDGATGAELGANDFRISTTGPAVTHEFDATSAAIAFNSIANEYLVTWEANKQGVVTTGSEIFGQRLSGVDGTEIGVDDFQISDATTLASRSDVAYNSGDNQYLIIWHSNDPGAGLDFREFEVFGQRITATGSATGTNDFRISDVGGTGDPDFDARDARVVYNAADHEYLVVWQSSDINVGLTSQPAPFGDTYEIEIFGQRLNAQTGAEVGSNDFLISDVQGIGQTVEGAVGRPTLAFNSADSEVLVVWHARDFDDTGTVGISQGIFGQRLADVPPNEAPVHSVPGPQYTNQGDTLTFSETNGTLISVNDADAGTGQVTTTITLDPGLSVVANPAFDSLSGTGAAGDPFILTKTGTIAEVNAALAQLFVTVNAGTSGQTLAVTLSTDDGGNTGSGGAQTTVDVIGVHVETANTAPTLSGLNGTPTFAEGGSAVLINADVSVGDAEQNWNGGTLTVSGLNAADSVAVRDSGTGAGQTSVSGSNIIVDGRIVAGFTGGASGADLAITFTAGASNAAVATILENLIYSNGSDAPAADRTLSFTLVDGAGALATGSGPNFVERSGVANPFDGLFTGFYQRPTFGDIDNDGDLDAFVGDTTGAIRFFRNDGSAAAPDFVNVTGAGNPFDGLDLGQNARPELADIDADGDLDLFVTTTTKTFFYRNTGTSAVPNYVEEIGAGPLLDGSTQVNGTLAFADIDNDGDLDAFAGIANGRTEFYRNTGTASAPAFTAISGAGNPLNGIDVGIGAAPSFADYDGDGDLDAFIGASSGTIRYFRNDGDAAVANFRSISGSRNPLNHVATGDTAIPVFADIDNDGDLDAFVGRSSSPSLFYESVPFNQVIASVAAVNDDPVNQVPGPQPTNEDTPLVFSAANGNELSVSDIDAGASDITTTLSVTSGSLNVTDTGSATLADNDTTTVTVTGTVAEVNAALATVTFTPALHASGPVTLTMTTNDGGNTGTGNILTDTDSVTINVSPVADAPTLALNVETLQEASIQVDAPGQTPNPASTVTALAGGGFVVTWGSINLDGDSFGVFAQLFDTTGTALGPRFLVNTETAGQQTRSDVTALSTGGFIVAWDSNDQDGDSFGVFAQRYDASGNRIGTEFQINTETDGGQSSPTIAELSNGDILVAWDSFIQDGDAHGVFAQRFDASGTPLGSEFQVNTYTNLDQFGATIGALNGGGFVIAWASNGQDGSTYGVYGQLYTAAGMPVGSEFQISTETVANQIYPSVAVLTGGDFVVAWESAGGQDGSGTGVFAQRFDATGNPLGGEFQVNTLTTGLQGLPTIAALADGGFVVTWSSDGSDGSGTGISGQQYNATGAAVGGEFPVNDVTAGDQRITSFNGGSQTAVLANGRIVSIWDDTNSGDGSPSGVFARILDLDDAPNGLEDQALAILIDAVLVDQDGSETLTVTLSGFPAGTTFNFGAAGAGNTWVIPDVHALDLSTLELSPPADYNGTFTLSVTARATEGVNGDLAETTATKEIVIAPVNDAPVVAAPAVGLTAVDQVGLDIHGAGFTADDIDAATGIVTATLAVTEGALAVSAGDSGVTVANSNSASVTVTGTIDQINNLLTDGGTGTIVYTPLAAPSATTTITVTVNDGGNTGRDPGTSGDANSEEASASQTIANTLSNTAPTLAGLDGAPVFTEGSAPVLIDSDITVGDAEQNWDGGTATVSGLDGSDSVAIRNNGNGPGETNIGGMTISVGMTPVATFTGGASGTDLVITFNAAATNADVEAVLENLIYSNASDAPAATRTLTITLTDGDGADASGDVIATVNPVNDAPVTGAATGAGAEDATSISVALSGTDVDGSVASFKITSLPSDGALFSDVALNNPVALNNTIAATGNAVTLFFVPNPDFTGTPTFTFAAIDDLGIEDASPATATIIVDAVNDAPQTAAATGTGDEDATSISVALSGSDIDGTVASFRVTSLPSDGFLFSDAALNNPVALNDTVAATGNAATLFFVPNPDFNGAPTFTFAAIDNLGLEDASPATATITVSTVNDAPQTAAANGTGAEDAASIAVALSGSDVDGTVASFRITSLPADGVLFSDAALNNPVALSDTIAATGNAVTLFFVPDANFNGTPSFTFAAIDNLGLEDASPATATITVSAVNDAPETNFATGAGDEDAVSISVALSGSDGDGTVASFRITSLPTDGVLYANAALTNLIALNDNVAATGNAVTLFFVPDANFSGAPSFTFAAIDNLGLEDASPATATITVSAVNDAPQTAAASGTGAEDAASIAVALSGSDVDGTVVSFRITSLPADGVLFSDAVLNNPVALSDTIAATGNAVTLFFVPGANFNGTPTFTFAAIDDLGLEDASPATATITVSAVNDAPQTATATGTGTEDAASIAVALSGSDVDGTVGSFRITSLPAGGTLFSDAALTNPVTLNDTVAATGNAATLFFVPNPDFNGAPTFTFAAIDDLGLEDASAATATITVSTVNDAPQTAAASGTGAEDAASIAVALSGSDVDGTVASFRLTSLPADGVLFSDAALNNPVALNDTVTATGNAATLFFVPDANFNGTPSFTFAAIDNLGLEDASPATATITVTAVNDAPETNLATGAGDEDAASIPVALSGSDGDGTIASFRITSLPTDGVLYSNAALTNQIALNDNVAATGNAVTLFFVPDANFSGAPSFTFAAIDNLGLEDTTPATATITVGADNDAPETDAVLAAGAEDAASISVSISGTDIDGNVASFRITNLPSDGTLFSDAALNNPVALNDTVTATGNAATLFFVPDANFNGTPSFTFAAIDDLGLEDASPATATITVSAVNDAPQTAAGTGTGAEDAASIAVALSGSDSDGTVASFRVTSLPSDGFLFSDAALNNPVALNDTVAATGNAATLFFVPNANFNGAPTFTFAAIDDLGLEDASAATATITVSTVNDAPQTAAANGTGAEDAASIAVALSGSDIDGNVASFRISSLPSDGTLFSDAALNNPVALNDTVTATGNAATLFFVPDANFNGTPSFTFAAIDNLGLEDASPATATITVTAVNDAPETNLATGAGDEDAASIPVALSGSDGDGTVASFRITSLPTDGVLYSNAALTNQIALNDNVAATGNAVTLFFVPDANFSGAPSFTFAAIDNLGLQDTTPATATITIGADNDAPETDAVLAAGAEDAASISVSISGTDIDGNVASFRITTLPSDGTLFSDAALNNPVALNSIVAATGNAATLFFVPNADFNGSPSFTFAAIDNLGLEDASPATATITVTAVNDAPETNLATGAADEDAASISVALSGSDDDGAVASFRITSLPSDGTLFSDAALNNPVALSDTVAATGNAVTLFFVPNPNFNGTTTFTFAAIDDLGLEDASPATATITINAVNDAPETNVATDTGNEDAASISVDLSASDIDGTVASFRITSLPGDGILFSDAALNNPVALNDTVTATGNAATLFFVPDANFNGTPSFTFAAIDNLGLEDASPATATITVNAVNDAPTTNVAAAIGNEDATSISVALSGGDVDGNVASFRITGLPTDGVLFSDAALNNQIALNDTIAAAGNAATLFFVPNADFNGAPTFTIAAVDNFGLDDATPATTTIIVNAVNDAPAITNFGGDVSVVLAGGDATNVDGGDNATASDLDGATDFDGGFVTFDITAGTNNGSFSFDGVNVTSGGDATISANETIRVGGTVIGTVSSVAGRDGQGGNLLRIDFDTGSATPESLSTLIRSLSYAAPSGFGDRTLTTTLNDGDGTANGGADETVVVSTIRVPIAPQVQSIERQDPASAETNADSVTFRVTFDTNVTDVDTNDFTLSGTLAATSSVTGVVQISDNIYHVTVDVPDNGDGTINLDISATPTIQNGAGINIRTSAASLGADETYTVDNTAPAIPLADLAAASDRGASNIDDITNDIMPVITGTVDANTNVTILSSIDGQVGQDSAAVYNGAGIMTSALSDGVHTLTILSTDVAGNTSMAQLTITIDTIAPTATSIGSPIAPADDAVVTFSETISFNTGAANFMTTLNAGAIVQDNFLATNANTSLSRGNTLTFARPTALALGSTFSAQIGAGLVTDIAGNTNTALTDLTTLVFETFGIPTAPAGLDLIAPSDTGQSSTDDITADATPTITGTADANATINLTSSLDGLVGTTQADAAGNWSITTSALRDGIHDFTATATNPAAVGPVSAILSITVDTTIQTPATPDLTAASDTGASPTDNVTFDKTPTLTGTAEPGATVTLNSSISGTVGTAVASATGTWTMTTGPLPEGDHVFTVGMVDIAGNISPRSAGLTVTIGTETVVSGGDPQTPTTGGTETGGQGSTGTDGSDVAGLGSNNDGPAGPSGQTTSGPNFNGSGAPIGSGFAGANTQDGGLPPAGRAPQGADPIITAGLGEQRPLTGDVLSESDLPGSISLDPASDSGFSNSDNRTGENQPVFIGEAPANSIVTITSSLGGILGTARVDATGKWTFQSPLLADGQHELIATPADEEGNKGVPSLPLLATIDTSAPETPAPPAFYSDIDQFRVDESRMFRGKAEPGARIALTSDQDGIVGEVIADENGNWQITGKPLSQNAHALTVTATDDAGNASAPSQALDIVVRGADDTALNFDPEAPISVDVTQVNGSVVFDTIDMTSLLKGFTRDIEGFEQAQTDNAPASQAVGFTRQLQRADAERMFA